MGDNKDVHPREIRPSSLLVYVTTPYTSVISENLTSFI